MFSIMYKITLIDCIYFIQQKENLNFTILILIIIYIDNNYQLKNKEKFFQSPIK